MADAFPAVRNDAGEVEVRIWFEQTDPPVGHLRRVAVADAPEEVAATVTRFSGWLALLRALSDVLGEDISYESGSA